MLLVLICSGPGSARTQAALRPDLGWSVAMLLQVLFKIGSPDLDCAPEPYARYLSLVYSAVDPTPAHIQTLTDLGDRQQFEVAALRPVRYFPLDCLLELQQGALELLEGLAVL